MRSLFRGLFDFQFQACKTVLRLQLSLRGRCINRQRKPFKEQLSDGDDGKSGLRWRLPLTSSS